MRNSHESNRAKWGLPEVGESLALAVAVLAGVFLVSWVLWRCRYGIDFTDEGYFLLWISNPWSYKTSITLFGFIYHPLYWLVGGDVVLLRQCNILFTLGLAWGLSYLILRTAVLDRRQWGRWLDWPVAGVAFVLSISSLASLDPWLPTPCYDSLALQALSLAGIGILLAEVDTSRWSLVGWSLIGFSGWLAFMAKPTTALALAIVISIYLVVSGKLSVRLLAVALATTAALGLISAWMIDGSVGGFVERLILGVQDAATLKTGHTLGEIWRLDSFTLGPHEKGALEVMTGLIFLAILLGSSVRAVVRVSGAMLTTILAGACIWVAAGLVFPRWTSTPFRGLLFWAAPYGAWLSALALARGIPVRLISRKRVALVLCLVTFPTVRAFGSNGNYWWQAPMAAIFWVLAGLPFLGASRKEGISWHAVLPMGTACMTITASLLYLSMEAPYRQPKPLGEDKEIVQIAVNGSRVRVAHEVADYINNLRRLARSGDFHAGDPMLDLTGRYPGALFAIGAKAIGQPWIPGGHPTSDELAVVTLARIPLQELRSAWILTEPTGPRRLSPDILKLYGIDLAKDCVDLGVVYSPKGEYPSGYEQHLFRPAAVAK